MCINQSEMGHKQVVPVGPEPPAGSGGAGRTQSTARCGSVSAVAAQRGASEMIWLFEGTGPVSDTIRSSSTFFIRVRGNFGTTEDPEEPGGKRSFATVRDPGWITPRARSPQISHLFVRIESSKKSRLDEQS